MRSLGSGGGGDDGGGGRGDGEVIGGVLQGQQRTAALLGCSETGTDILPHIIHSKGTPLF